LDPRWIQFQVLTVRLKGLDPYPVFDEPLDSSLYVVTLEVGRAAPEPVETK